MKADQLERLIKEKLYDSNKIYQTFFLDVEILVRESNIGLQIHIKYTKDFSRAASNEITKQIFDVLNNLWNTREDFKYPLSIKISWR